jgi:hypothetical protein
MASADLNAVLAEYNGTNLQQLIKKYNLKNDDIVKLRQLNAKIDKELGVKDGAQPLPDSKEITLDDGTKVLAAQVRTVNQPKGGKVNVYMAQDGKQYYQYVDANGKQQKITKTWNSFGATWENFTSSVGKIADGHLIDGVVQMFSGAEDPRGLITGEAPTVGFAKGSGLLSKLKDVKKWGGAVKSFAKSCVQKFKLSPQSTKVSVQQTVLNVANAVTEKTKEAEEVAKKMMQMRNMNSKFVKYITIYGKKPTGNIEYYGTPTFNAKDFSKDELDALMKVGFEISDGLLIFK